MVTKFPNLTFLPLSSSKQTLIHMFFSVQMRLNSQFPYCTVECLWIFVCLWTGFWLFVGNLQLFRHMRYISIKLLSQYEIFLVESKVSLAGISYMLFWLRVVSSKCLNQHPTLPLNQKNTNQVANVLSEGRHTWPSRDCFFYFFKFDWFSSANAVVTCATISQSSH